MNIFTALFLLLLALKLLGISISWWLVFAPLLVALVIFTVVLIIPAIIIWRS